MIKINFRNVTVYKYYKQYNKKMIYLHFLLLIIFFVRHGDLLLWGLEKKISQIRHVVMTGLTNNQECLAKYYSFIKATKVLFYFKLRVYKWNSECNSFVNQIYLCYLANRLIRTRLSMSSSNNLSIIINWYVIIKELHHCTRLYHH